MTVGPSDGRSGADASVSELTEPELRVWAFEVGREAALGTVFVCLTGELGTGKSTLARAACRGAGVVGPVPSPTFTLIHRHRGGDGSPLYHADLYRLTLPEELHDIGWADLLQADGAVFLEWAERVSGYLPPSRWDIHLEMVQDPERRRVTAHARGGAPAIPSFTVSTAG
jgi:tRNA threonylcarbamoyladenosine biosynthesis protein TsaE